MLTVRNFQIVQWNQCEEFLYILVHAFSRINKDLLTQILSTLMCSKKFDVAFVDPEIVVPQCLHLALKLLSGLSGML